MSQFNLNKYGTNVAALFGPSMIGFEHIEKMINDACSTAASYPPFNIKKAGENQYVVEMAVAGFKKSDITITLEDGKLKISGKNSVDGEDGANYLHRGIAARDFMKMFSLNSDVEVVSADMTNGMLKVWLERLIPESAKPKIIPINEESTERATVKALTKDKK